jgi:hypothetical protein
MRSAISGFYWIYRKNSSLGGYAPKSCNTQKSMLLIIRCVHKRQMAVFYVLLSLFIAVFVGGYAPNYAVHWNWSLFYYLKAYL